MPAEGIHFSSAVNKYLLSFVDIFDHVGHTAFQQLAELIDGICGNTVAFLYGIISSSGKAHFFKSV